MIYRDDLIRVLDRLSQSSGEMEDPDLYLEAAELAIRLEQGDVIR